MTGLRASQALSFNHHSTPDSKVQTLLMSMSFDTQIKTPRPAARTSGDALRVIKVQVEPEGDGGHGAARRNRQLKDVLPAAAPPGALEEVLEDTHRHGETTVRHIRQVNSLVVLRPPEYRV